MNTPPSQTSLNNIWTRGNIENVSPKFRNYDTATDCHCDTYVYNRHVVIYRQNTTTYTN